MSGDRDKLLQLIDDELDGPVPQEVRDLADQIRLGRDSVVAVLFYGAGLWKSPDSDTVFDFYVLIGGYRAFDDRPLQALLGWMLPPNVYYLEHAGARCKYAVIRQDQFESAVAGRALTTQIWARFAQPCRLLYARDAAARRDVVEALAQAVMTFHSQVLALLPPHQHDPRHVWISGLEQTYANEWRSERSGRAAEIYAASRDTLDARSRLVLPECRPARRVATRGLRRVLAKAVYFLQLAKAVFTFDGGVDYALWKIERQSGVKLHATDFQRRHPLISAWPLVWKAWRLGGLR